KGNYYVTFLPTCAPKGNFAPQMWKAAPSVKKATVLRVGAHQNITHINAVLGVGAVIKGRVRTLKNPHPSLGGLCVEALGTGGRRFFAGIATTHADGSFRLPSLATGSYKISITPFCGRSASPYLPARLVRPVHVTNGKVTSGVTAFVKLGGSISGTVTDTNGTKLAGICVDAFSQAITSIIVGPGSVSVGSDFSFAEGVTSANGSYRVVGLTKGSYEVDFSPGCGNNGPYGPATFPDPVSVRLGMVTPHVD